MDFEKALYESNYAFTPSIPIDKKDLFSGRKDQVARLVNAIAQPGKHAIIYGERGVGKTSLARIVQELVPGGQDLSSFNNCNARITFTDLFRGVLSSMPIIQKLPGAGFTPEERTAVLNAAGEFATKKITPNDLRAFFQSLKQKPIIVVDELDRIEKGDVKKLIADTIKEFSDHNVGATFILVGVADSVDELIQEHQSISRALVQVHMPRMNRDELKEIIQKGLDHLGMEITSAARDQIVGLSQGLPHYTHQLSLYAAQSAIKREARRIETADVNNAITESINSAEQSLTENYHKAVHSPRGNLFKQVLLACALAKKDEQGFFTASSVVDPLGKITGRSLQMAAFNNHLKKFRSKERGPILTRKGHPRRYRYRFTDPLMEPFVVLHGIDRGLVGPKDL